MVAMVAYLIEHLLFSPVIYWHEKNLMERSSRRDILPPDWLILRSGMRAFESINGATVFTVRVLFISSQCYETFFF
jgi:hypothetical protein